MITKKYIKSRDVIKLTFEIPKTELPRTVDVENVYICGDFNAWNRTANPMQYLKNGRYKITLEVQPGTIVQFRYLANQTVWFNDWKADSYAPGDHGDENCVVVAEI